MIAVFTDSSAQLSSELAAAAGIEVIPQTIVIDDDEFLDGEQLAAEVFYDRLAASDGLRLSTSQPAPGLILERWNRAVDRGATRIVSVHVGEQLSGTLNAARLVATELSVPVDLIDSGTTSFGTGVIALRVAGALRSEPSVDLVRLAAETAASIETVFILQDLRYIVKGGRMHQAALLDSGKDIPILGGAGGAYQLLGQATDFAGLVDGMAEGLLRGDHQRDVAIAFAAPETIAFTEALEERMRESELVRGVHRYRMGPTIAVHTGPGTAGGFSWPAWGDEPVTTSASSPG